MLDAGNPAQLALASILVPDLRIRGKLTRVGGDKDLALGGERGNPRCLAYGDAAHVIAQLLGGPVKAPDVGLRPTHRRR